MKTWLLRLLPPILAVLVLLAPLTGATVLAAPPRATVYVVEAGDTLLGIARRFGVSLEALAEANGISNVNLIYVGQRLTIPDGSSPTVAVIDSTVRDLLVAAATAPVHASPSTASALVKSKRQGDPIHTLGRVTGGSYQGSTEWYRVALSEGGSAYMPAGTLGEAQAAPAPSTVARMLDSVVRDLVVTTSSAPVYVDATPASALVKSKFRGEPIRTLGKATGAAYNGSTDWYRVALGAGGFAYMPAATLGSGSVSSPAPAPAPSSGPVSFGYGIQVHMIHQDHGPIIHHLKALGVGWVKQQVPWQWFEPNPGELHWGELDRLVDSLHSNGFRVLLSVPTAPAWSRPADTDFSVAGPPADYSQYGRFMREMAARYKGKVQMYEVWNEQNLWYEWGGTGGRINASQYVELLRVAYQSIKAVDPAAIVVSGAPTPTGYNDGNIAVDDALYLEQMYQAGLKSWSDAIGIHPSGYKNSPLARCCAGQFADHRSFFFRDTMEAYRNIMLKYGDGSKKLIPTEFGWASTENVGPANAGYEYAADVSEAQQAQWIREAFQQSQAWGWVGPMFLWNLNFAPVAGAGDEKAKFGILRPDWSARPSYWELANLTP